MELKRIFPSEEIRKFRGIYWPVKLSIDLSFGIRIKRHTVFIICFELIHFLPAMFAAQKLKAQNDCYSYTCYRYPTEYVAIHFDMDHTK